MLKIQSLFSLPAAFLSAMALLMGGAILFFIYLDASISTDGSYDDIRDMEAAFRKGRYRDEEYEGHIFRKYPDGSWAYLMATDSHSMEGGGTIGVLESSGKTHFWFDHVCGFGEGVAVTLRGDHFDPHQSSKRVKEARVELPERIFVNGIPLDEYPPDETHEAAQ